MYAENIDSIANEGYLFVCISLQVIASIEMRDFAVVFRFLY